MLWGPTSFRRSGGLEHIVNLSLSRSLPALLAAVVLALAPACAAPRHAPRAETGPIENPHIVERIAPRDPDVPTGIERNAGHGHDGEAFIWLLVYLGYAVVYIAYGIGWCFVELGGLIYEACTGPHYEYED
jgi:hypothetical protein